VGTVELVRVGKTEFFVEVVDGGGPETVGLGDAFSFDGVTETVETIATQVSRAWEKVHPAEASVEFGLALSTKTGKLTGLLVEGTGEASLKVTVTWRSSTAEA
jgi:Trypsin-co-occurring domain 1